MSDKVLTSRPQPEQSPTITDNTNTDSNTTDETDDPPPQPTLPYPVPENLIPFANWRLEEDHIAIPTAGGDFKAVPGIYCGHFHPHTGHAYGKWGTNWGGFYALDTSDPIVEHLGKDGMGQDVYGIPGSVMEERWPVYTNQLEGMTIFSVKLLKNDDYERFKYYQNWFVEGSWGDGNYYYGWDHMARLDPELRDILVDAGCKDPYTCDDSDVGKNLITGDSIPIPVNCKIGLPQVRGFKIFGHEGYYSINSYAQIESFPQISYKHSHLKLPWVSFLNQSVQDKIQSIMYREVERWDSSDCRVEGVKWLWTAEMKLFTRTEYDEADYSSIINQRGSWIEWNTESDTHDLWQPLGSEHSNDGLTLISIQKDNPFYDPALYSSPDVSYVACRTRYNTPSNLFYYGEVISPKELPPQSGSILFKWRAQKIYYEEIEKYQGARYVIDLDTRYLKMIWTKEYNTKAEAESALAALADPAGFSQPTLDHDVEGAVKFYRTTFGGKTPAIGGVYYEARGYN